MTSEAIQLSLLFLTICNVGYAKPPTRIIDAEESYNIPYQVSIQDNLKENICGGAILDASHILTAAHCIVDDNKHPFAFPLDVVIGTNDRKDRKSENVFQIVKKTIHEDFEPRNSWKNDIAVLKLDRNITFNTNRSVIELPISDAAVGTKLMSSGWGATQWSDLHEQGDGYPRYLRYYYGAVISQDHCQREMVFRKIHPGHICMWSNGEGTSCQGDSGNPLVDGNQIIGITSFNNFCNTYYPDVFIRVYYYVAWIRDAMND